MYKEGPRLRWSWGQVMSGIRGRCDRSPLLKTLIEPVWAASSKFMETN